ncbi:MAG: metallophosphoesterase [Phocaeicola sp.]
MMIVKMFLAFLLLLILPAAYVYSFYIKSSKNRGLKICFWTLQFSLTASMLAIFSTYEPIPNSLQFLSKFLLIYFCFMVPQALFTLTDLLLRTIEKIVRVKLYTAYIAASLALLGLGSILHGSVKGIANFQVREVTIHSHELPKGFDGYRMVQFSDFHAGSWTGNKEAVDRAVQLINDQKPDIILFTGDLVNNLASEIDEFSAQFSQLESRDGIYSVLGNHDYSPYIKWDSEEAQTANLHSLIEKQESMGWRLLNNEHTILRCNNDSIALVGVENIGRPPFPSHGDLAKALKGTNGMYKVLLSHDPTHWRRDVLPNSDVQLTLAGHTHNMQFQIGHFQPSRFAYKEHNGLYEEQGQTLFVNIGLGYIMFPMRIGAWPEIAVITLKHLE